MLNIVLFGPPGAGKGTQAEKLIAKYNLNHISTGEVIRQEIKNGSELGESIKDYIQKGELAPDSLVIEMVANFVKNNSDCAGNIFDGFPRTTHQAEKFDEIMSSNSLNVDMMLSLEVPDDSLVERLLLRGKDSGRADDSSEDVIRNRIAIYKEQTAIVANFYEAQGKHISVNGLGTIDEIFSRLCAEIDKLK